MIVLRDQHATAAACHRLVSVHNGATNRIMSTEGTFRYRRECEADEAEEETDDADEADEAEETDDADEADEADEEEYCGRARIALAPGPIP